MNTKQIAAIPNNTYFKTISAIKETSNDAGNYFFKPKTMRFFNSKIESTVLRGRFFITSEQPPHGNRVYSLRMADNTGDIHTIGKKEFSKSKCKYILSQLPPYFYDAYELACISYNTNDGEFLRCAEMDIINGNIQGFDSFVGACAYLAENYEWLGFGFIAHLLKDSTVFAPANLSLDQLNKMPTLSQGHFDNIKIDTPYLRVMLSRCTVADGAPYDNQVTVLRYVNGNWQTVNQYQAR